MVYEFASTSKVTFPGAGISVMATSEANQNYMQKLLAIQTISYDKVNQLRHVRYLKDKAHTLELMKKHAAHHALRSSMCVLTPSRRQIAPTWALRSWQRPKGGYFVSCNAMPGTREADAWPSASEAGVVMTGAGATFPYGIDPQDSNIRIAPSPAAGRRAGAGNGGLHDEPAPRRAGTADGTITQNISAQPLANRKGLCYTESNEIELDGSCGSVRRRNGVRVPASRSL